MKDAKYLLAYTIPLTAFIGIYLQDIYIYLTPFYAFGILPVLEQILPKSTENLSAAERENKLKNKIYDWLLYLNLPITYATLTFALYTNQTQNLSIFEIIGLILSTGIVLGTNGINVAHELGHRVNYDRFLGKLLLLPSLYMHFFIEHNYGHHLNVATDNDPATAKYNQPLYHFWIRSVPHQYINAWKIQNRLLQSNRKKFLSFTNDMLWYSIISLIYLSTSYIIFNFAGLLLTIASGIIGFLLLETINYIEHYGLKRAKKPSGRYERVSEEHSWNSNHSLGRIVLYELTRHSDHHYKASKKYQILDHHDKSPQLPLGYPGSMLISLIPPLWFKIMNKRVPDHMKTS